MAVTARTLLLAGGALMLGGAAPDAPRAVPGFAARLADTARVVGPAGWRTIPDRDAWRALALATPDERQPARWHYALSLIGSARYDEAVAVLEVMQQDDPDLAMIPNFRLAQGTALSALRRDGDALIALSDTALIANPEASVWRMRALAHKGDARGAVRQVAAALPAINARPRARRDEIVLLAAKAAIDAGAIGAATGWLALLPEGDAHANLLRGEALRAAGDRTHARLAFARAAQSSDGVIAAAGAVEMTENDVATHRISMSAGIQRVEAIGYGERGGQVERRALTLRLGWANSQNQPLQALASAATLVRYFPEEPDAPALVAAIRVRLKALLAPDSGIPIATAAGLFWEYRDQAPVGSEGDALAYALADRLEAASLYDRAAQLLAYQLTSRSQDVAQGPLSIRVARLFLLAGAPQRALATIRDTAATPFPQAMQEQRGRLEAIALAHLGNLPGAVALLSDIPGGAVLASELQWRAQDWNGIAATTPAGVVGDVARLMVLRRAIALGMLDRPGALAALRAHYSAAFRGNVDAALFDVLTKPVDQVSPAALDKAMSSLPSINPTAEWTDVLDAGSS